jgi:hypothetical protein
MLLLSFNDLLLDVRLAEGMALVRALVEIWPLATLA